MVMYNYLISFGANLDSEFGSPMDGLKYAINEFSMFGFNVRQQSKWYSSLSYPDPKDPKYINGCLEMFCEFEPFEVLTKLKNIEKRMGRTTDERWSSRTCDFDILSCRSSKNFILPSKKVFRYWFSLPLDKQLKMRPNELVLPHPRMQDRSFVLIPLYDIQPNWIHPVLGVRLISMIDKLSAEQRLAVSIIENKK